MHFFFFNFETQSKLSLIFITCTYKGLVINFLFLKKPMDFTLPLSKGKSHRVSKVTEWVRRTAEKTNQSVGVSLWGYVFTKAKSCFKLKKYFLKYTLIEYFRHNTIVSK